MYKRRELLRLLVSTPILVLVVMVSAQLVVGEDVVGQVSPTAELEDELRAMGLATDTQSLIGILELDEDLDRRWLAAEILGFRDEVDSVEALRARVSTDDEALIIRQTAALGLARLGQPDGPTALRDLLREEPDAERQIVLAGQLAERGIATEYGRVVSASRDSQARLRYISASVLVSFIGLETEDGVAEPLELLLGLADDSEASIRLEAMINLPISISKGVAISQIRPTVERLASNDSDPDVQRTASLTLAGWDLMPIVRTTRGKTSNDVIRLASIECCDCARLRTYLAAG